MAGSVGKRGPAPLPANVLKMRGTYRGDRHGGAQPTAKRPKAAPRPPDHLTDGAKREWRRWAKRVHDMGILTEQDSAALEAYCIVRDRAIEAEKVIARDGRTVTTPQGMKRHPELVTAEKAWADCRRYEQYFGLTPSARMGMRVRKTKDDADDTDLDFMFGDRRHA